MIDKPIKEQYQDKAQEVLERRPKDALIHSPNEIALSQDSNRQDTLRGSGNASYAKKVIASGRKITTEPEPIHYPKRTTDNASCPNPKENDHFCKHGTHITKIMGCIKCVEEKRGSDNKGCGKIEEEVFEGKVIETYVCGTRASEFNAVYLCDKCRTTDNKGCANPPKSLREYYLGEGEFDFERKIKKEMITDSPGKYSEEYQALKKFGSDKADCTNTTIKDCIPKELYEGEMYKLKESSGNQNCANCGHGRHTHYRLKGACYDECEKKCKKFISSNKEKSK